MPSHNTLKLMRQAHRYIGLFTAPAVLFFAFTGALQTFNLHETTHGSAYNPPSWIVALANLHKRQSTSLSVRRLSQSVNAPRESKVRADIGPPPKRHLPVKIFFLLVCVALFTSTITGIFIAYKSGQNRFFITGLLLSGGIVPLVLNFL